MVASEELQKPNGDKGFGKRGEFLYYQKTYGKVPFSGER